MYIEYCLLWLLRGTFYPPPLPTILLTFVPNDHYPPWKNIILSLLITHYICFYAYYLTYLPHTNSPQSMPTVFLSPPLLSCVYVSCWVILRVIYLVWNEITTFRNIMRHFWDVRKYVLNNFKHQQISLYNELPQTYRGTKLDEFMKIVRTKSSIWWVHRGITLKVMKAESKIWWKPSD